MTMASDFERPNCDNPYSDEYTTTSPAAPTIALKAETRDTHHFWEVVRVPTSKVVRVPIFPACPHFRERVRLLEQGIASELGGEVGLQFAREGLSCVIRAPISPALYPAGWTFPTAALA